MADRQSKYSRNACETPPVLDLPSKKTGYQVQIDIRDGIEN